MMQSLVALVALVSVCVYFWTVIRVGQARAKHGIKAPAVVGHPDFERAYRIQMNTLEQLVPFLPVLYISARYNYDWIAVVLGAVWIVGRILYVLAYAKDPDKRGLGFTISGIAFVVMLIAAILGVLRSFF